MAMILRQWQKWLIFLLATLITLFAVVGWQNHSHAQSAPAPYLSLKTAGLTLKEVDSGIYALISSTDFPPQDPNIAICNGGIVIGDEGVLVIDPFQNEALGNLMLSTARTLTKKPVRYVVNTHFHFDHTGGNSAIIAQNIPLIGRGDIRDLMLTKNTEQDPNPTPPRLIINSNSEIWLGKRKIMLEIAEGHTPGTDLMVYIPDADVLFTGDILFYQRFPYMADGDLQQWRETLTQLISRHPETRIVPGHGSITDKSGLESLKQYLDYLYQLAVTWKEKSLTPEQAIASATPIPTPYQSYKFQALYPSNLETAYQQITQGKKPQNVEK